MPTSNNVEYVKLFLVSKISVKTSAEINSEEHWKLLLTRTYPSYLFSRR